VVDNGEFFPENDAQSDYAWFLMDMMKTIGTDAVGVGSKDLRFGAQFLTHHVKRSKLDVISTNVYARATKKPLLSPWVVKKVGNAKVGIFSVMSDKVDLGPARDSLYVEEPTGAAQKAVKALRAQGATVVVALSQLGKVESEDLAAAVEGIDVVIAGHNVPLVEKGRQVKSAMICYGGEQGQNVGRTIVTLDAKGHAASAENQVFVLLPAVGEVPEIAKLVKDFEDSFNERQRKLDKERAAQRATQEQSAERFLGSEVCVRCHVDQAEHWKNTPHAHAFQTLVDAQKESTPECVPCHVVGFNQAGGFKTSVETPGMKNVGCENCHGMGTQHEAFAKQARNVTEATCVTCHQGSNDPEWNFEVKFPKVVH
jgi:hypothetical protein